MELSPWANLGFGSHYAWLIGAAVLAALVTNAAAGSALARAGSRADKAKAAAAQLLAAAGGISIGLSLPYAAHLFA